MCRKVPKNWRFSKTFRGTALPRGGQTWVRGEGREGKWAQGRAPSPKKGKCALCLYHSLQYFCVHSGTKYQLGCGRPSGAEKCNECLGLEEMQPMLFILTVVTGTPLLTQASLKMAPKTTGKTGRPERDQPRIRPHLWGRDRPNVASGSSRWSRERLYKTQPREA